MGSGGYDALAKRKLMESIWDKMDEGERLAFALASMLESNHREAMGALAGLGKRVDASGRSWLSDFGANVAGNAAFGGGLWLLSKVFGKLV